MQGPDEVDSLIDQLARLHVQQADLQRQLARLHVQQEDLQRQEGDILRKLLVARGKSQDAHTTVDNPPQREIPQDIFSSSIIQTIVQQPDARTPYHIGDRVRIIGNPNRSINNPIGGKYLKERDQTGTVTKVTPKRVFFRTDNNQLINRAPHNLTHLIENER